MMHMLTMLQVRERGFSSVDFSNDNFAGNAMDLALNKLCSHSIHDTYPCTGLRSSEGLDVYDVPPFVSRFAMERGSEHILAVASEEGEVLILDTNKCHSKALLTKFAAHNNAIFDICWANDEPTFITASGDSKAVLWDVSTCTKIAEFSGHLSSVKTVHFNPQNKYIFATGSRDGSIIVWDTRMKQDAHDCHADNIIRHVHQISGLGNKSRQKKQLKSSNNESVTAVVVQDDKNIISAGVGDGLIKVWDLRKSYSAYKNNPIPKYVLSYPGKSMKKVGYASLVLNSSCSRLFASCTDSTIYEFNCVTYSSKPVAAYHSHSNSTYFVKSKLSPCDRYLVSGSSDHNAYIWKVGTSGKAAFKLSGHNAEVTSVDWCRSSTPKIVTCSDDKTYRIWRIPTKSDNNELQITHGIVEKIKVEIDESSRVVHHAPQSVQITPAKISPLIKSHNYNSPLQNIQNVNSIESSTVPYSSPTQDLPNLVIDRLRTPDNDKVNMKRKTSSLKKMDWLTEFSTKLQQQSSVQPKRVPSSQKSASGTKRRKLKQSLENDCSASKCLEKFYK